MRFPSGNRWTETLPISFDEVKDDKARMDLPLDRCAGELSGSRANSREKAMANIQKAVSIRRPTSAFNGCARYYIDNGIDPKMVFEWAQKSVSMERKFWN